MSPPTQTQTAQQAATAAWHAAQRLPNAPRGTIDAAWQVFVAQTRAAAPAEHMAIAIEAEKLMRGFRELAPKHLDALTEFETQPQGYQPHRVISADHAWNSHPILAAFHAAQQAAQTERDAQQADTAKLRAQQADRDAPRMFLMSLRSRGLDIGLTDDGKHVTLPPAQATTLLPSELETVKQHKAGLVAVLKAEAEAARPVVLA